MFNELFWNVIEINCFPGKRVDERLSLVRKWMVGTNYGVRCIVKLARAVPGFLEFSREDQIIIIKGTDIHFSVS